MPWTLTSGVEFGLNTYAAANQTAPSIAYLSDGGFVVVWGSLDPAQDSSESAIKGQRFDAAGNKVGTEFLVNSQATGSQFTADVATFADGRFVVTWTTNDTSQDGNGNAVKARLFDADGTPIGPEFLVNSQTISTQDDPHVTVLDNGNFVVSWNDWSGFDMKAQVFAADGQKIGGEIRLNTSLNAAQEYGDVMALAGGGFVASWRTTDTASDGSGQAVIARVFDSAGVGGAEIRINTATAGNQNAPSLAALADGGFVIAWNTSDASQDGNNGAVKAQRFDATGTKVGPEFLVNTQAANLQYEPVVAARPDGGFAIVWQTLDPLQDGSSMAVKGQYFDASGQKIGGEFLVNGLTAGAQFLPAVTVLADGTLAVAWTSETGDGSGYAVRGRLFDLAASPVIGSDGGADSAAIGIEEGQAAVTIVTATDADTAALTYAIVGGADASLFTIDSETGELAFAAAPDFEAPADADSDNVYEVIVSASDGQLSDSQALMVSVGNVNDVAPVIASDGGGENAAVTIDENGTAVTTVSAGDADGPALLYAIAGGADASLFTIDAETGALAFAAAPDFEAPADADGNNVYELVVSASDGLFSDLQGLAVSVGNVNDVAPVIISDGGGTSAFFSQAENGSAVTTVVAGDADGSPLTYGIAGGDDGALFAIDAATGVLTFISAPDFEAPADFAEDNFYIVHGLGERRRA